MKINALIPACFPIILALTASQPRNPVDGGYVFERDAEVAKPAPGPHNGGGNTVGYSFFENAPNYPFAFRKRVLLPGSAIGYHQDRDEVYYILSGTGELTMNGQKMPVKPGDAILTRPGSSHGLVPTGRDALTLIITYEKK